MSAGATMSNTWVGLSDIYLQAQHTPLVSPVAQVLRFTELALLNHNHDFESSKIWRVLSNWGVKPPSWLRRLAFFSLWGLFVLFVCAAFYCNHIATGWARVPHTIRVLATHYVVDSPGFTVTFFLCGLLSASMLWLPSHRYGKSTARHICGLHIGDNSTFLCTSNSLQLHFWWIWNQFNIVTTFKINENVASANPSSPVTLCRPSALNQPGKIKNTSK